MRSCEISSTCYVQLAAVFRSTKIQDFAHFIEYLILNELLGHCMQVLVNLVSNAMKVNFDICALFI